MDRERLTDAIARLRKVAERLRAAPDKAEERGQVMADAEPPGRPHSSASRHSYALGWLEAEVRDVAIDVDSVARTLDESPALRQLTKGGS